MWWQQKLIRKENWWTTSSGSIHLIYGVTLDIFSDHPASAEQLSSRKSSNSKSAVTSHAFKVSYPIFYSTCESCYVAIMAVVTPVVLIYAWKDWTFQVGCSSDATIPGTFFTVVVQIIAIVIFFTSWNSLSKDCTTWFWLASWTHCLVECV